MKKIAITSAALLLASIPFTAEAQYRRMGGHGPSPAYGGHHGYHGGGYRPMAYSYPAYGGYGGYYRRNNFNSGALVAGLIGSALIGGLFNAALPIGAFGGGFGAFPPYGGYPAYGGGYDPYSYQPYPVRQKVIYVQPRHRGYAHKAVYR